MDLLLGLLEYSDGVIDTVEVLGFSDKNSNFTVAHTTIKDFIFAILGWAALVYTSYLKDKEKFEDKITIVKFSETLFKNKFCIGLSEEDFIKSYKYWSEQSWKWKVWWDKNNESLFASAVFSFIFIIAVPESWSLVNQIMSWDINYVPIVSIFIGFYGGKIGELLEAKFRSKNKKLWNIETVE